MRVAAAVLLATFAAGAPAWAAAGDTRLVDAVKSDAIADVRAALKLGVDVNATMPDGATALHWAAHRDRVDIADALLEAGAQVNVENDYGVSPITLAATNGSAPMIERLIAAGARVNATLPTGETNTALIAVCGIGHVDAETRVAEPLAIEAVQLLLDLGSDINEANAAGNAPLHAAAMAGYDTVVAHLVEHGAAINARNKAGETPLKLATGFIDNTQVFTRPSAETVLRKMGGVE